jgi:hypothetical protein
MRFALLCLLARAGTGLLNGEQQSNLIVRSISVRFIPTGTEHLMPVEFAAIAARWKNDQVNLAVERKLDIAAIDRAEEVIREMYRVRGETVRVEHSVRQLSPRTVEVGFEVVPLCQCN